MATATDQERGASASGDGPRARRPYRLPAIPAAVRDLAGAVWELTKSTSVALFRYRVTGLAAEAAFWALLSLPPLVLGLIGLLGHFRSWLGTDTVNDIRLWILDNAAIVLTGRTVDTVVAPIIDDVFRGGPADLISLGFVVSLWSGSRALNVYVDTITIAYGLAGHRGVVRTRALSFGLYVVGLLVGLIVLPLLVAGPTLVEHAIPATAGWVNVLYWPVVMLLSICFLTSLYTLSVPVRTAWWRDLPGAVLAVAFWVTGSALFRAYLGASFTGSKVYGSLGAPVAILAWLFLTALAVLVGAALNAEIDKKWPSHATAHARGGEPVGVPRTSTTKML